MSDWHVVLSGAEDSARGQGGGRREFIIRDVTSATEAERAALRVAAAAGITGATVVGCYPWTGGEVQAPTGLIV